MRLDVADNITAAMEENERGQWLASGRHRRIDPQRDFAAGTRASQIGDFADRHVLRTRELHKRRKQLARLRRRQLIHLRPFLGRHLVEKRLHDRIERHREAIRELVGKFAQARSAGASGHASLYFTMAWLDQATQRASVCEPNKLGHANWDCVVSKMLFAARTRGGWVGGSRPPMEKFKVAGLR